MYISVCVCVLLEYILPGPPLRYNNISSSSLTASSRQRNELPLPPSMPRYLPSFFSSISLLTLLSPSSHSVCEYLYIYTNIVFTYCFLLCLSASGSPQYLLSSQSLSRLSSVTSPPPFLCSVSPHILPLPLPLALLSFLCFSSSIPAYPILPLSTSVSHHFPLFTFLSTPSSYPLSPPFPLPFLFLCQNLSLSSYASLSYSVILFALNPLINKGFVN